LYTYIFVYVDLGVYPLQTLRCTLFFSLFVVKVGCAPMSHGPQMRMARGGPAPSFKKFSLFSRSAGRADIAGIAAIAGLRVFLGVDSLSEDSRGRALGNCGAAFFVVS
jgi:hypothetical protein